MVTPLSREQREELERLEREARSPAAPLPWKVSDLDWRSVEDAEERVVVDLRVSGPDGGADISRLIPAMRNALPSLLASARRLEELESDLTRWRQRVYQYGTHLDDCPAHSKKACRCGFSRVLAETFDEEMSRVDD